jgi:hypothetical protein
MMTDVAKNASAAPEQEPSPADQDQTTTDEATRSHESLHTPPEAEEGEIELALPPAGGAVKGLTTQLTGGSNLHQRLLTTATDVRLAALHARLLKSEHDYEIAEKPAAAQGLSTISTIQRKNDEASKKAFKALKRAYEALINDWPDLQNTTTWFIQDLFGDTGLQNLCQQISQSSQADQSSWHQG